MCKQSVGWRGTDIPNKHEISTKDQSVTEWYRYGKCGAMNKNVSACVATKSKPWNTLNYLAWDMVIWMQSLKEFKAACEIIHF